MGGEAVTVGALRRKQAGAEAEGHGQPRRREAERLAALERIAGLTANDFEEILIARLALETFAVRITVPALGSADIATLEGDIAQMEHYQRVGDGAGLRGPHRSFHQTLVAAAGKRVSASIGELTDYAERYRNLPYVCTYLGS